MCSMVVEGGKSESVELVAAMFTDWLLPLVNVCSNVRDCSLPSLRLSCGGYEGKELLKLTSHNLSSFK